MHDDDFEHGHPSLSELGPGAIVQDVAGIEMFMLTSVGIDIGSATSHLVFSRLTLRREGASLSGRYQVAKREVLFRSRILLTPFLSETFIDTQKIEDFIHEAYDEAGLSPRDVDTGAVIITGEALKKENARPITAFFAREAGKFICAAAGHNQEALLAAYGSGAVDLSAREQVSVLNVDMGGGTTKFALIQGGLVLQTASISVGARLIAFDETNIVTRIEASGRAILAELGYQAERGKEISLREQADFADCLAKIIFAVIEQRPFSPWTQKLLVTEPLQNYLGLAEIDYLVFSGGVAEHVYSRDQTAYGDVGPLLGGSIRARLQGLLRKDMLREPCEGIRATVIGAGEYTIQASGHTSYISSPRVLPVFGLKVIPATLSGGNSVADALGRALAKFDLPAFTSGLALSLTMEGPLNYPSLRKVAEGIAAVLETADDDQCPLYMTINVDVARSLGAILKEEFTIGREIIALDGIDVGDLDYIDIGAALANTEVIPVTVKSLMFPPAQPN